VAYFEPIGATRGGGELQPSCVKSYFRQGGLAAGVWRRAPKWARIALYAPVAQLDRALPSEGRGQGFESLRVRHL
jgi:hypothetical protein